MLRGRSPASSLVWAQPTPAGAAGHLCLRAPRWVPPTSTGLPDHWLTLSVRAVPPHPGRPGDCTCPLLRHRYKASSTWGAWPPATWRFEAESGSLALRLAPSLCGVPSRGIAPADRSTSYVSNGPLHGCLLSCSKVGQVHWRFPRRQERQAASTLTCPKPDTGSEVFQAAGQRLPAQPLNMRISLAHSRFGHSV